MAVVADIILVGLDGAKPAASASNNGYLYLSTDIAGGTLYRSNGSGWVATGAGASVAAALADPGGNGIVKRTALNTTGVAASSDVTGLFSGVGDYLKSDGTKGTPATGTGHTIQDEGSPLTARTNLNFVGAGVAATDDAGNDATIVTINGGTSGADFLVVQVFS